MQRRIRGARRENPQDLVTNQMWTEGKGSKRESSFSELCIGRTVMPLLRKSEDNLVLEVEMHLELRKWMGWRHRLGTSSFSMIFEAVRAGQIGQDCGMKREP